MKYKINTLNSAFLDIKEIKQYLKQFYPSTVKRFVESYKQQTIRLKNNPYICERFIDDPDYRRLVMGDYLVFYKVYEEKKMIEIHRVLHGARDAKRHLD